jgi:hypothetical protein
MKSLPMPSSGGSFKRDNKGKLVQTQKPTAPASKKQKDRGIVKNASPETEPSKEA